MPSAASAEYQKGAVIPEDAARMIEAFKRLSAVADDGDVHEDEAWTFLLTCRGEHIAFSPASTGRVNLPASVWGCCAMIQCAETD